MESVKFVDTRTGEIVTRFDIMDIQHMVKLDEYKGTIKPWTTQQLIDDEFNLVSNQLTDAERDKHILNWFDLNNIDEIMNSSVIDLKRRAIKEIKEIINNR